MKMITDTLVELAKKNESLERTLEARQMELMKLNSQLYDLTEENRKLKKEVDK
jgi:septal ring factor EnvC (AmiA/AmiB activator)